MSLGTPDDQRRRSEEHEAEVATAARQHLWDRAKPVIAVAIIWAVGLWLFSIPDLP